MSKMTENEKKAWDDLYEYVKYNILKYDDNQALSSYMVLRLKGLLSGKFIENSKPFIYTHCQNSDQFFNKSKNCNCRLVK